MPGFECHGGEFGSKNMLTVSNECDRRFFGSWTVSQSILPPSGWKFTEVLQFDVF